MSHEDVHWEKGTSALANDLQVLSEKQHAGILTIETECPRCGGVTHTQRELERHVVRLLGWRPGRTKTYATTSLTITCDCGHPHEGRPDGETGCGFYSTHEWRSGSRR